MDKIWLKHYPTGVPAEVKIDLYPSLVALLDESFRKYRNLPAYKFMGAHDHASARSTTCRAPLRPGCRRRAWRAATASRS